MERFEFYDELKSNPNRRCLAWENTILVKARNRDDAYKKATSLGKASDGTEAWFGSGRKGAWRFEGLTMLLPIYEELEHGAEILWDEHVGRSVKSIRAMVRTKRELAVFDDSEIDRANLDQPRPHNFGPPQTVAKTVAKKTRG